MSTSGYPRWKLVGLPTPKFSDSRAFNTSTNSPNVSSNSIARMIDAGDNTQSLSSMSKYFISVYAI